MMAAPLIKNTLLVPATSDSPGSVASHQMV